MPGVRDVSGEIPRDPAPKIRRWRRYSRRRRGRRFSLEPVPSREGQHKLCLFWINLRSSDQHCAFPRKVASQRTGDIEHRPAAAEHALIMRSVAHYIALSAQDGILQRNRIENSSPLRNALDNW